MIFTGEQCKETTDILSGTAYVKYLHLTTSWFNLECPSFSIIHIAKMPSAQMSTRLEDTSAIVSTLRRLPGK